MGEGRGVLQGGRRQGWGRGCYACTLDGRYARAALGNMWYRAPVGLGLLPIAPQGSPKVCPPTAALWSASVRGFPPLLPSLLPSPPPSSLVPSPNSAGSRLTAPNLAHAGRRPALGIQSRWGCLAKGHAGAKARLAVIGRLRTGIAVGSSWREPQPCRWPMTAELQPPNYNHPYPNPHLNLHPFLKLG